MAVVPELLHPDRHAGLHFALAPVTGPPGRFLDVHGTPIAGADPDLTANILGADPQTGLNRLYGSAIAGGTGASVVLTEGGQRVRTLATFPGRAGGDVRSTFDLAVQRDGEAVLDPLGPAREAALVAIDTAVRRRVGRPVGGDVPGSAAGRSLIRPGRPAPSRSPGRPSPTGAA